MGVVDLCIGRDDKPDLIIGAMCGYDLFFSEMNMLLKCTGFIARTSVLSTLCVLALTVIAFADTLVQVEPTSVNFGQVSQGETATAKFHLTNAGTKPLTIQFMEFSIPGMRAQVKARIDAGKSTGVLVTLNTSGLIGDVEGETTLTFNDPGNMEVILTISGTVVP